METYKIRLILIGLVLVFASILPVSVFAYDQSETHPALARASANLFRQNGGLLTNDDINAIALGSDSEDVPMRFLRHFYDPINNRGLWGTNLSSKEWAQSETSSDVL